MTDTTYDGILRQALGLPDQEKVRLLSDVWTSLRNSRIGPEGAGEKALGNKKRPDPAPAMAWLNQHRAEYGGQWVALDGDRLIAHGPDSEVVFNAAKADGAYLPLVTYIEPVDAPSFLF
ncbi:MAG: DUF5678 domain-containing protein [Blastocatellia bacterium]